MPAAGGAPTQLTNTPSIWEGAPTFSPDGKTIVYGGYYDDNTNSDIFTMPAAGGTPTNLTNTPSIWKLSPTFSPDGEKIAYSAGHRSESGHTLFDIFTMPATGGTATNLTNTPSTNEYIPDWSPDGKTIVYDVEGRYFSEIYQRWFPDSDIFTIPAAGGTPTQLTDTPGTIEISATFSPDGSKIAYNHFEQESLDPFRDIFTIPAAGGTPTNVTENFQEHWEASLDWGVSPTPTGPKSKAECKKGGYKDFGFKTQGKCMSSLQKTAKEG
jgi:Tol biopolymer transport system component